MERVTSITERDEDVVDISENERSYIEQFQMVPSRERVETEILWQDYYDYLLDRFSELRVRCEEDGYMWFDSGTANFQEFFDFAMTQSTGPPRVVNKKPGIL